MGFYASGTAEITVPANSTIILALATDTLPKSVRNCLDGSGDLVRDILENACWFDVWFDETDDAGMRILGGGPTDKWPSTADEALRWLAEQGCGVAGQFTGDDDAAWSYDTMVGHGSLVEYGLSYVPDYQVDLIGAAISLKEALGDADVRSFGLPPNVESALIEVLQKASTP